MKKLIFTIFIILFLFTNVYAYSNYVIPGGETIGIKIESDGLVVVGFYKVNGNFIGKEYLKVGDTILSINGINVHSIDDLTNVIDENINNDINIEVKRNNKVLHTKMNIEIEDNIYKTGLYIKDGISGIGTLTYIDPISKIYGALGHEIAFSETNTRVEVRNGHILESKIIGIDRSVDGYVGSKNAQINFNNKLGTIKSNTEYGIFGTINTLPNKNVIPIGSFDEIKKEEATIYTVTSNNDIKEYKIDIVDKYSSKINTTKCFSFEIIDHELLNETGGVVQGMSGSPIVQNNKIIGAVTHVLVDNVELGYGICIKTMLEEGEK